MRQSLAFVLGELDRLRRSRHIDVRISTVIRGYVASRAMIPPIAPEAPSMAAFDAIFCSQLNQVWRYLMGAGDGGT